MTGTEKAIALGYGRNEIDRLNNLKLSNDLPIIVRSEHDTSTEIILLSGPHNLKALHELDSDYQWSDSPDSYPCLMAKVYQCNFSGPDEWITRFIYPDQAWALIIENAYAQTKEKL